MKNVLVTGGAGFIGSNFIHYLRRVEAGIRIINLDALTYAGNLGNLAKVAAGGDYIFIQGDICNETLIDQVMQQYSVDTVVHFAAETHVDRSISSPIKFVQTNVVGTFTLLEAARRNWLKDPSTQLGDVRFHHISTDEVFGSLLPDEPPFTEDSSYMPNSPYAATKASSDHLVRSYARTYGLPVTITNCSNNYGPYQFPEKFIPLIILHAMAGKPLPVYGDGQQVRDWLYVEDHCEAIHAVIKKGKNGETYNVGGKNQPTNLEILFEICAILDELLPDSPYRPHSSLVQMVGDRPGHDRRYAMNIARINSELGWTPKWDLRTGLRSTVEWYLSNVGWVNAVLDRPEFNSWMQKNYNGRGDVK